jgi:flagellin
VDDAITTMSENVNSIGITQSSLSVREETLSQSISANESAKSRIMDTDFAKAQSESVRLQILQQTATSALAQANNGPQSVLGFIG